MRVRRHMASHVCDTWHAMCQHAWLTMKAINMGMGSSFHTAGSSVRGSSKEKEEEGRKGEEKGRKGKEKGRRRVKKERRKEKKKGEEERKKKEEKEGVLRSEQTRTAKNLELRYKR